MNTKLYFDSLEQRVVMSAGIAPSGANLPAQAEVSIRSEHSIGASVEAPNLESPPRPRGLTV